MTIQAHVQDLVRKKLVGREIDVASFVDELLELTGREGAVACTFVGNDALHFALPGRGLTFDLSLDAARGKLRMMCARLSVLCSESGGDVSLYGGEGDIVQTTFYPSDEGNGEAAAANRGAGQAVAVSAPPRCETRRSWHVRFQNTMHAQEFTITPVEESNACP